LIWVGPLSQCRIRSYRNHVANAVSKRYCKALSGAMLSSAAFDKINGSAGTDSIEVWTAEEERAKRECTRNVAAMDIYDIKMERREFDHSALFVLDKLASVPSRAEILLELTKEEIDASGHKGHAAWLASGLKIQEMQ
jgi:hypothetical protein